MVNKMTEEKPKIAFYWAASCGGCEIAILDLDAAVLDVAAKAGVKAIIQPGGSIRDKEVIDAANTHGISMVFSGQRYFRH